MRDKRHLVYLALIALVASVLACNAPTPTATDPQAPFPTATPHPLPTLPPQKTVPPSETPAEATPTSESPEATETATAKAPPPTATQPSPTSTPTSTPTQPSPGGPLVILDPGFEIADWNPLDETGEWEGHLRAIFTGGVPPYTFALENQDQQSENYLYIRWRKCLDAPLTIRVWSADGQETHKGIWVVSPYCPD